MVFIYNELVSPWVLIVWFNFYLFTYEFDFIKCLWKSNTCPLVLHRWSLAHRFVNDIFIPNFPAFVNSMCDKKTRAHDNQNTKHTYIEW
jgi:hypothetical protein